VKVDRAACMALVRGLEVGGVYRLRHEAFGVVVGRLVSSAADGSWLVVRLHECDEFRTGHRVGGALGMAGRMVLESRRELGL
jgi:hypothetical protein